MEVVEGSCHSSHRYAYSGSLIDYVWGCALTGTIVVEALVGLASLLAVGVGLEVGQLGEGVGLEVGQLGEGVGAVWMATLVGLVPGVSPDVLLQVGPLCELPLPDLAAIRLGAEVNLHVF